MDTFDFEPNINRFFADLAEGCSSRYSRASRAQTLVPQKLSCGVIKASVNLGLKRAGKVVGKKLRLIPVLCDCLNFTDHIMFRFQGYIYKQLPEKEVEEEAYLKKLAQLYGK